MKYSKFFIPTLREAPNDAVIASHQLMLRAGLMRKLGNGLFSYLPLGYRAFRKVEQIIREEMDAIGSCEMKASVVCPGELWKESGRWDSMGSALLRFKNRTEADFVLSPTNEESFTAVVREYLSSYKQLPLNLYHINTKYRDEVRPRYGVMRGREFTMKDAYTFHTTDESLDEAYHDMDKAYRRIFKRCGLHVISVKADSGAIGGTGSEEFMVESVIGDNTLILCKDCDYAANVEKASCKPDWDESMKPDMNAPALEKVHTPHVKTIAEASEFLGLDAKSTVKTLVYLALNVELDLSGAPGCDKLERKKLTPDSPETYPMAFFAVCIRGDRDVNEAKLCAKLRAAEIHLASDIDVKNATGSEIGSIGPVGLTTMPVVADESCLHVKAGAVGALDTGYHYRNAVLGRDWTPWMVADLDTVQAGDVCVHCGGELYEKKGNELGHIFKLQTKYSKAMGVTYLDENGKAQIPTMGCYGIGLDRTLASVIEEYHDKDGIIWPMTVAPYHVIIVPIRYEGAMKEAADRLYAELGAQGIEVLLDDRDERVGVKFNDADLIGIPYRIVVSGKHLETGTPSVELRKRGEKTDELVPLTEAATLLSGRVKAAIAQLNS